MAKVQKKMLTRFLPNGILEIVQQPDVSNRIAHIWIQSNREVFGFDEYTLNKDSLVLEIPVRSLLSVMRASEGMEDLKFEFRHSQTADEKPFLTVSSGNEFISFTSTVHQIPVIHLPSSQAESFFREPLISTPSITFSVPAMTSLHGKLSRLAKQSSCASLAANHQGRFVCSVTGTNLQAELVFQNLQIVNTGIAIRDPLELIDVDLSLESLVRVLGCLTALQGQAISAIVPKESIIFSTKIANPCGPDRPSGSITLILAAFEPH